MRLYTYKILVALARLAIGLPSGSSVAESITQVKGPAASKFFNDPVFGVPFLESSAIFQGPQAVLGFEIGCRQNMVSPNIHEIVVNGSVVDVTVNVTITSQCFVPTRIFRYAFGADPTGNDQINSARTFAICDRSYV